MRVGALVLVALVLAATAAAKGPATASACGASGCREANPQLLNPIDGHAFALARAPRPAPYYVAILSSPGDEGFCWRLVWVPKRRLLRVENLRPYRAPAPIAGRYWRSVHTQLARNLGEGFRGVTPYGASRSWKAPAGPCST